MGSDQGDYHCRKFGPLRFMDRNSISQYELISLAPIVIHPAPVKLDRHRVHDGVESCHEADVAVENVFVVVVLRLNDLVPNAELPAKFLNMRGFRPGGIQLLLEADIQLADAQRTAVHRAQHLDVA